jgi:phospholipase C
VRLAPILAGGFLLLAPAASAAEHAPRTPIRHVITVMQENHSFDNYFGTYPGTYGLPRKVCMPRDPRDPGAGCVKPFPMRHRPAEDLSDAPQAALAQLDGGRMDGFLSAMTDQRGRRRETAMGFYDRRDLPFYWSVADQYVLFDAFFGSALGGSLTNHMFWVTGGPGDEDPSETVPAGGFVAPTIFDRLQAKGISWRFYVGNYHPRVTFRSRRRGDRSGQLVAVPPLNYARFVDDRRLFSHIVPLSRLSKDMQRGTLPAVSYVVPLGAREHPPGSLETGQSVVRTLLNGLIRSRYWSSSAFMLSYDSSGGWYDHVPPPRVDRWGLGFRVPALLVSAYARHGHVDHTPLDFTSILKFIEDNWGLRPLTDRDRHAKGLMSAFDFGHGPRPAAFVSGHPRRTRIVDSASLPVYATYGAAFGVALLVVMLAVLHEVLVRRRSRHLRGPSSRVTIGSRRDR